jgi:hypothetical protein
VTDPAAVNARIAAILQEHDDPWRVPEALAEAMHLWGSGANEHGVFCDFEAEQVAKLADNCKAEVLVAQSGNGLFGYGLRYEFGMGGGGFYPCVFHRAFGTKAAARKAALEDLAEALCTGADRRQAELLRKVKGATTQRTLFG